VPDSFLWEMGGLVISDLDIVQRAVPDEEALALR